MLTYRLAYAEARPAVLVVTHRRRGKLNFRRREAHSLQQGPAQCIQLCCSLPLGAQLRRGSFNVGLSETARLELSPVGGE